MKTHILMTVLWLLGVSTGILMTVNMENSVIIFMSGVAVCIVFVRGILIRF